MGRKPEEAEGVCFLSTMSNDNNNEKKADGKGKGEAVDDARAQVLADRQARRKAKREKKVIAYEEKKKRIELYRPLRRLNNQAWKPAPVKGHPNITPSIEKFPVGM